VSDVGFEARAALVEDATGHSAGDFPSEEAFKDYVDAKFAEIQSALAGKTDRAEVESIVDEKLHDERRSMVEAVLPLLHYGSEAKELAVVAELCDRAKRSPDGESFLELYLSDERKASRRTPHEWSEGGPTTAATDILGHSKKTCRKYLRQVAEKYEGITYRAGESGGWQATDNRPARVVMVFSDFVYEHGEVYETIQHGDLGAWLGES